MEEKTFYDIFDDIKETPITSTIQYTYTTDTKDKYNFYYSWKSNNIKLWKCFVEYMVIHQYYNDPGIVQKFLNLCIAECDDLDFSTIFLSNPKFIDYQFDFRLYNNCVCCDIKYPKHEMYYGANRIQIHTKNPVKLYQNMSKLLQYKKVKIFDVHLDNLTNIDFSGCVVSLCRDKMDFEYILKNNFNIMNCSMSLQSDYRQVIVTPYILNTLTSVQYLELNINDEVTSFFSEYISNNTTLTSLKINSSVLNCLMIETLMNSINKNSEITSLFFGTGFSNHITYIIDNCSTVTELTIGFNNDIFLNKNIIRSLIKNTSLIKLRFDCSNLHISLNNVERLLSYNITLQSIKTRNNSTIINKYDHNILLKLMEKYPNNKLLTSFVGDLENRDSILYYLNSKTINKTLVNISLTFENDIWRQKRLERKRSLFV